MKADLSISGKINAEAASKNIPLSTFIECTYKCNGRCYFCFQSGYKETVELSVSQWGKFFADLADMGGLYLTISGGEPFMRKDFCSIVEEARHKDFAVSIITNGTLVTQTEINRLRDAGIVSVGISFHAGSPDLHDKLSGITNGFTKSINALRSLRRAGIAVVIKHSVTNINFGHYKELQHIADSEGCIMEYDSMILPVEGHRASQFSLSKDQTVQLLSDMHLLTDQRGEAEAKVNTDQNRDSNTSWEEDLHPLHCDAGRSILGIAPDGDVYPCIILPLFLGNIEQESIKSIWKGKKSEDFRKKENRLDTTCKECSIRSACSRCHGVAYRESVVWSGPAPSLCERAMAMSEGMQMTSTNNSHHEFGEL